MKAGMYAPKYILQVEAKNLEELIKIKNKLEVEGYKVKLRTEAVYKEIDVGGGWIK